MHILLRCDATRTGGAGHFVRAFSLAEIALDNGWRVTFSGDIEVPFASELLDNKKIRTIAALSSPTELAEAARELGIDLVHIDHYGLKGDIGSALNRVGVSLSSMEDGEFGRRDADLVIDPNPAALERSRPLDGSGATLFGIDFAPLRHDVLTVRRRRDSPPAVPSVDRLNIVVMLGGTDAANLTGEIARLLASIEVDADCTVVAANADLSGLAELGDSYPQFSVQSPTPDLSDLYSRADLAVIAAGTSVWEMLCMGIPAAVVQVVENQTENYQFVTTEGLMVGLGSSETLLQHPLVARGLLSKVLGSDGYRSKLAASGKKICDGRGAERIVARWERLVSASDRLEVYSASASDASILHEWRNEATVRAASRNSAQLGWSEHVAWLNQVMEDKDRRLLIIERADQPVGTVRFDRLGCSDRWEVSITVAPNARGKGLGTAILGAAERYFAAEPVSKAEVVAFMLPENQASRALFSACGYAEDEGQVVLGLISMRKRLGALA